MHPILKGFGNFPTKNKSNKTASYFKIKHQKIKGKRDISEELSKFFANVSIELKRRSFFLKDFVWAYMKGYETSKYRLR